jgi:hypothetical protein
MGTKYKAGELVRVAVQDGLSVGTRWGLAIWMSPSTVSRFGHCIYYQGDIYDGVGIGIIRKLEEGDGKA